MFKPQSSKVKKFNVQTSKFKVQRTKVLCCVLDHHTAPAVGGVVS